MQIRRTAPEAGGQEPWETLVPKPRHSNNVWRNQLAPRYAGGDKAAAAGELTETIGPETWLVWGSWSRGEAATAVVYRFPTPTDCLLWYRWCLLGIAEEMEALETSSGTDVSENLEYDKELILLADDMRTILDTEPGAASVSLLYDIEEDAVFFYGNFLLHGWESIHDYLSRAGDTSFWQEALGDQTVQERDGQWQLTPESWERLHDWLQQNAFNEG